MDIVILYPYRLVTIHKQLGGRMSWLCVNYFQGPLHTPSHFQAPPPPPPHLFFAMKNIHQKNMCQPSTKQCKVKFYCKDLSNFLTSTLSLRAPTATSPPPYKLCDSTIIVVQLLQLQNCKHSFYLPHFSNFEDLLNSRFELSYYM